MAKELMEIGGFITSGAEIVNHDASLSGNGTVDSPLGVVPGYNETVLWEGDATPNGLTAIAQLSEPISAFDSYEVYCSFESLYPPKASKFKTPTTWELQPNTNVYFGGIAEAVSWKPNENNAIMNAYFTLGFGTNLTDFYCISGTNLDVGAANGATATRIPYGAYLYHVYKVVGINRIGDN